MNPLYKSVFKIKEISNSLHLIIEHSVTKNPTNHYSTALYHMFNVLNRIHIIVAHTLANDKNAILL